MGARGTEGLGAGEADGQGRDGTGERWYPRGGDYVMWVRAQRSGDGERFVPQVLDFWECRDGDEVVVAGQGPEWLGANPEIDAPMGWRVQAGDWIAWTGLRPHDHADPHERPTVIELTAYEANGVVVRELADLGADLETVVMNVMGGPTAHSTETAAACLRLGLRAIVCEGRSKS